ncbi:MAG: GNAT family N-acetyltransferase [Timaviella obliquedivisa GSE-PSE-MK23-08B]|jgi:RimJ/RimL family protein N-acetyltransferase|nr:GNAT family N-acetyltransferase [Timaviella obliquedivisa GSE-PSE-MK23-08B]
MSSVLRPTTSEDLDFVLAAENHSDNRDFVSQWTRQQHEEAIADPDALHFIIEAEGAIGYTILYGLTDPNQVLCIQRLVITQKGKGYGKATLKLLQKLAFEDWNTHRLWLDVKDYNHRAWHVYESVGFRLEGILRECVKKGEHFESFAIFSILKPEYQSQLS